MKTFPDLRIREALRESRRAGQFLEERDWAAARDAFVALRSRLARLGLRSGYVDWGLAVALDNLGELEMAFQTVNEAIRQDPLNPAAQESFEFIAEHLRTALADPRRAPDDPTTPRLYDLLQGAGEADVPGHLAMARHLAHAGDRQRAMRLLDAVTLLSPLSRDAWLQKASLARAAGDEPLAASCEAQAAAVVAADPPYGVPTPRGVRS